MSRIEPFVIGEKGKRIFGIVELPDSGESFPAVIMLHGFGGQHITTAFKFPRLSRKLVEKGFATVRFDFRGSGDSEGDFIDVTPTTELNDALEVISWVRNSEWCNNELYLLGYSLGGFISALVAASCENLKSICMWAPAILNKEIFKGEFAKFKGQFESDGYIDLAGLKLGKGFVDEILNIDASKELEKYTGPVMIIHGSEDKVVPYEPVKKYATIRALKFHSIEGAGHKFESTKWIEELLNTTVEFFESTR